MAPPEICKLEVITRTDVHSSPVILSALGIKVKDKKGKTDSTLWILRVIVVEGRKGKKKKKKKIEDVRKSWK